MPCCSTENLNPWIQCAGYEYKLFRTRASWVRAKTICGQNDGFLATPRKDKENQCIYDPSFGKPPSSNDSGRWIGIYKKNNWSNFQYIQSPLSALSTEITFSKWNGSPPPCLERRQKWRRNRICCVFSERNHGNGSRRVSWRVSACAGEMQRRPFVCQRSISKYCGYDARWAKC